MQIWRIRQFGAVSVEGPGFESGKPVNFGTQRAAKILILLSLEPSGRMLRADLADALWPDDFYDATRLRLRKELSRLRQSLSPTGEAIVSEGESIVLDRTKFVTDLDILRRTVAATAHFAEGESKLLEAIAASEGKFLPGWDDPWAVAERSLADSLKSRVVVMLGGHLLALNTPSGALEVVREAILANPCDEAARMIAVRAYFAMGSPTAAVGEFQQMKRAMRDRNLVPSSNAESLLQRIQTGETDAPKKSGGFPPLAAPLDRFFGREQELSALTSALSANGTDRLVTLVGTGGIGKTRLASEAALKLRDSYLGNVAFVSLAGSSSPRAAAATLLSHLGWQGTATADPAQVVAASLPEGPCLIVLDNLEHLMPGAAELVRQVLEACSSLKILATSRRSLRLGGEKIFTLGPLGAATEMLCDLANAGRPGQEDDPDLAELAERLDRIPLALRLVAPRLRVLDAKSVLARLGDRFALLQSDSADLPTRHRSLRAALDGSFDALDEHERNALIHVAPFRGGWSLAHLDRILPGEDGLTLMESLIDASLVSVERQPAGVRFTMLETIREYAIEHDALGEARRRFAKAIADELWEFLPELLSPRNLDLMQVMDVEADNLHVAAETAIQEDPVTADRILSRLWSYDTIRGRHRDMVNLYVEFEEAHPTAPANPDREFGHAMSLLGMNRIEDASSHFTRAQAEYEARNEVAYAALSEFTRLSVARRLGLKTLEETRERFKEIAPSVQGSRLVLARFAGVEGDLSYYSRHLDIAGEQFDLMQSIAHEGGDQVVEIVAVLMRSFVSLDQGKPEEAQASLLQVEPFATKLGDPERLGLLQELLGRSSMVLKEYERALGHFHNSREYWSRQRNGYQIADQDNSIARALTGLGRFEEAVAFALAAFDGWKSANDLGGVSVSLHSLCRIRLSQGRQEDAADCFLAARTLAETHNSEFVQNEVALVADLASKISLEGRATGDIRTLFKP